MQQVYFLFVKTHFLSAKYSNPRAMSRANTIRSPMFKALERWEVEQLSRRNVLKSPPINLKSKKRRWGLGELCLIGIISHIDPKLKSQKIELFSCFY